jgi:nucleoside-diphosphate-sugar epimerase
MTRVLVTGAAGFIGHHVVARLRAAGYQVAGLDRCTAPPGQDGKYYQCDLLDAVELSRALADAAPDAVLHLAARTGLDGAGVPDYAANVEGVANLVESIRGAGTVRRAVCTSTQLVCRIGYQPASDTDYQPSTPYGASKVRTEQIWRAADGAGTTWSLVRPTTIWGPRMNPHYLRFFRMIREGRYVHVSGGPHLKSYGYVGNTVFQYQRLLEAPADRVHRRTFYAADYEPLNLEAWAERFRGELGAPPIRTIPRMVAATGGRVGDVLVRLGWRTFPFTTFRLTNVVTSYLVDLAATREVCGELPFSQDDGVAATVAWLREIWASRPAAGALLATT